MNELNLNLYQGYGVPITERKEVLPGYESLEVLDHPKNYIAGEGLRHAVNVALTLGQPLLVTGEPGTGKTKLAESMAWELGLPKLEFHTKTTSSATDLFYRYDALRRFQDAHFRTQEPLNIDRYIDYQALGLAILLTKPGEEVDPYLPDHLKGKGPTRSVVLIDEIDKAPRDLPNDLLNELERMAFTVKENGKAFIAEKRFRPILVLTSNSEKNLPDPFLRRCIFYHIPFPSHHQLMDIIKKRFAAYPDFTPDFIKFAIDHFLDIRELPLIKKPATAELLSWLQVLRSLDLKEKNIKEGQLEAFAISFSVLAKSEEDFKQLRNKYRIR